MWVHGSLDVDEGRGGEWVNESEVGNLERGWHCLTIALRREEKGVSEAMATEFRSW